MTTNHCAIATLLVAALASCGATTPAEAVRLNGGIDPVICYALRGRISACRDGTGSFWVCAAGIPVECVRAEEPSKVFALPELRAP